MIFYLSATGNSLYVAKELAAATDDRIVSIPQAIHDENPVYRAEAIGIVAPVYSHDFPPLVKKFIRRATFECDYLYVVMDYGNRSGGAAQVAARFLAASGNDVSYANEILMVDNWLPGYDVEGQLAIDKRIDENLAAITADVSERKQFVKPASEEDRRVYEEGLAKHGGIFENVSFLEGFIEIGDSCIGCGICERICPAGCIHLEERGQDAVGLRAVRAAADGLVCTACLACVHACPQKALTTNPPEVNPNAHFLNEHVKLIELVNANDQTRFNR